MPLITALVVSNPEQPLTQKACRKMTLLYRPAHKAVQKKQTGYAIARHVADLWSFSASSFESGRWWEMASVDASAAGPLMDLTREQSVGAGGAPSSVGEPDGASPLAPPACR